MEYLLLFCLTSIIPASATPLCLLYLARPGHMLRHMRFPLVLVFPCPAPECHKHTQTNNQAKPDTKSAYATPTDPSKLIKTTHFAVQQSIMMMGMM